MKVNAKCMRKSVTYAREALNDFQKILRFEIGMQEMYKADIIELISMFLKFVNTHFGEKSIEILTEHYRELALSQYGITALKYDDETIYSINTSTDDTLLDEIIEGLISYQGPCSGYKLLISNTTSASNFKSYKTKDGLDTFSSKEDALQMANSLLVTGQIKIFDTEEVFESPSEYITIKPVKFNVSEDKNSMVLPCSSCVMESCESCPYKYMKELYMTQNY